MAKPKPTEALKIFNVDLPLTEGQAQKIYELVTEEGLTEAQKIGGVALGLLQHQAEGGLMLKSAEIDAIEQCTGVALEEGIDLIPILSEATGRVEGKLMIPYYVDPADEAGYQAIADAQGRSIEEVFQEITTYVMDNEMVYNVMPPNRPEAVYMLPATKQELEGILEGTFSNGTELAALVKKFIGADGLFEGVFASSAEGA